MMKFEEYLSPQTVVVGRAGVKLNSLLKSSQSFFVRIVLILSFMSAPHYGSAENYAADSGIDTSTYSAKVGMVGMGS
jgi:hypothetical protein